MYLMYFLFKTVFITAVLKTIVSGGCYLKTRVRGLYHHTSVRNYTSETLCNFQYWHGIGVQQTK